MSNLRSPSYNCEAVFPPMAISTTAWQSAAATPYAAIFAGFSVMLTSGCPRLRSTPKSFTPESNFGD